MLMSKHTQVTLKKQYKKILFLFQAYRQTFIFLCMLGPKRDCLVHVTKQGIQLFQYQFQKPISTLNMITQYQCITLQTYANCITILDLRNYQFKRIPFYFITPESDQVQLYMFAEGKYFTVVEYGKYNQNRIKFSYFNYPKKNPKKVVMKKKQVKSNQYSYSNIIQEENIQDFLYVYDKKQLLQKQFYAEDGKWTYQYIIKRGNNKSMILWYKPKQPYDYFEIKLYHQKPGYISKGGQQQSSNLNINNIYNNNKNNNLLKSPNISSKLTPIQLQNQQQQNGWQYKQYCIKHQLSEIYQMNNLQIVINTMFQIQQNKLLSFCISNRIKNNNNMNIQKPINNNFIINLQKQSIRQSSHNFSYLHDYQIDQYLLGTCHMVRFYSFQKEQPIKMPIYYLMNDNFQLICQQQWLCTYLNKYAFPGYDSLTMIQALYENANVKKFECWFKKIMEFKEIALFFLLEINRYFDEDLLNDVINMIEWKK